MRFKYAAAVWRNKESVETFAFPMVYETNWGVEDAYPLINDATWEFLCVLPAGQPAADLRSESGRRVSVLVGRTRLHTADWNLLADSKSPTEAPAKPKGAVTKPGVVVTRAKRRG